MRFTGCGLCLAVRWGLGGEPRTKSAASKPSVWITSELFRFVQGPEGGIYVELGTLAKPLARVRMILSRSFDIPASLRITVEGNAWFVSFASGEVEQEQEAYPETREEMAARLALMGEEKLMERSWGGDRGVAIPLAGSDGLEVDFSAIQKERMRDKEKKAKACQKKFSRQCRQYAKQKAESAKKGVALPKTSGKQRKTLLRIQKQKRYAVHARDDVAHKATTKLAQDERYQAFALEKLQTKNMIKAPKPKVDPDHPKKYLKNGKRAKAGLNKAIRASMWGRFALFLEYKAKAQGKLFLLVDPKHTSQECSECGSVSSENRLNQAVFSCSACGHTENADHNAGKIIKARMVASVMGGTVAASPKVKKVAARKGKFAAAGSRVGASPRPVEEQSGVDPDPQASTKRESSSFKAR